MSRFAGWCGNLFIGLVVVAAILTVIIGPKPTANLYQTGAIVVGTGTGITAGVVPEFFSNVKGGQALIKKDTEKKTTPKKDN